jgi:kynureninase
MDWLRWREEFPILSRTTYLNSCSLGALGRRAEARVRAFEENWNALGAAAWYETWMARLAELRGRVSAMLGARDGEVALAPATSVALATIASALDHAHRPKVVLSELDFPTLAYPWMVHPGVEVVRVPSDDGATVDPARFADAVDDRTALLATSHVFFATGAIQELGTLAEIAHARGALLLVDAYQGAGQVPIDVHRDDVDLLTTGPLKWLLGGPGLAYLYARDALLERLRPTIAGWFGARDQFAFDIAHFEFKEDARRFELGTPSLPSVHYALGGQDVIDEIGVGAIRERNRELTERLVSGALDAGFRLRIAPDPEQRSAIVMVALDEPAAAVAHLARRGIIVDHRPGHVRISPHFYNTQEEVERVVAELAAWRSA